jgi:hypothetical protein
VRADEVADLVWLVLATLPNLEQPTTPEEEPRIRHLLLKISPVLPPRRFRRASLLPADDGHLDPFAWDLTG